MSKGKKKEKRDLANGRVALRGTLIRNPSDELKRNALANIIVPSHDAFVVLMGNLSSRQLAS